MNPPTHNITIMFKCGKMLRLDSSSHVVCAHTVLKIKCFNEPFPILFVDQFYSVGNVVIWKIAVDAKGLVVAYVPTFSRNLKVAAVS